MTSCIHVSLILLPLLGQVCRGGFKYCQEAVDNVESVTSCPTSEKEWESAANRKNCQLTAAQQTCSEPGTFLYHCVINGYGNETLEVCAPRRLMRGYCTEFNVDGGVIQSHDSAPCNKTTVLRCDDVYYSTHAYKYPDCYDIVYKNQTISSTTIVIPNKTTISDQLKNRKTQIIVVAVAVVVAIAICIVITVIGGILLKRRKTKTPEIKDIKEMDTLITDTDGNREGPLKYQKKVTEEDSYNLTKYPDFNLQDRVCCHICESPRPQLHCDICDKHLCKDCEESKEHKNVPFELRGNISRCQDQKANKGPALQQFGSVLAVPIKTEEHEENCPGGVSSPPDRPLINAPKVITCIDTMYKDFVGLRSPSCLNDGQIWACSFDKIIRLYNLEGKLVDSIQTQSGNFPSDIAVTKSGELIYTDYNNRTVNKVKNTQIETVIILQGWKPRNVCTCSTAACDLLVVMNTDDNEQTKVVRYSGSTEMQSIQYDAKGQPLYSSEDSTKCISENRNLDICVADNASGAVVVVNKTGKFMFRYTGFYSETKRTFYPYGITTDSQSRILTTDRNNHCIHIIDQVGQFLCYIDTCGLNQPRGLCIDTRDNLFVAEWGLGTVKKIQYCM